MMAWYVFAFVDERPTGRRGSGLSGALSVREVPGGFVVVERRADVVPTELGALKKHDAVIARLANAVPAILPVRFGTLMEMDEIEEALQERDTEIAAAFALVRGRVQFSWRDTREARREARGSRREARGAPDSGTEYLRRAARAASPAPPPVFRTVRDTLRSLVAEERFQSPTTPLPGALYHLVDRGSQERYRLVANKLASPDAGLRVTGPWAPFAFTPDLL